MSPETARSATAAAPTEFNFPIERTLATLATTSSESLANVAVAQRRRSLASSDVAAVTVPRPNTRSLIPMVRSSSSKAPVGCSRRDKRRNGPGAAISAAPTAALSQPILATTVCVTGAAYRAPERRIPGEWVSARRQAGSARRAPATPLHHATGDRTDYGRLSLQSLRINSPNESRPVITYRSRHMDTRHDRNSGLASTRSARSRARPPTLVRSHSASRQRHCSERLLFGPL